MQKKNIKLYLIQFAIGGILGLVLGIFMIFSFEELNFGESLFVFFTFIISLIMIAYFHTIVHECGHMLFGLLTGYKFVSIRFGSLILIKKNDKLYLKKYKLAGTGGQCFMSPPNFIGGSIPFQLYHYGGSILNIIVAFISLGFALTSTVPLIKMVFMVMCAVGILYGAINGFPLKMGILINDGYNVKLMKNNLYSRIAVYQQLKVMEYLSHDISLKDMPKDIFFSYQEDQATDALIAGALIQNMEYYLDLKDYKSVSLISIHLNQYKDDLIPLIRYQFINLAYITDLIISRESIYKNDIQNQDHKQLTKVLKSLPTTLTFLYAQSLFENNDIDEANHYKNELQQLNKNYPYPVEIESQLKLINQLDQSYHMIKERC